jgi:hypothetical protein
MLGPLREHHSYATVYGGSTCYIIPYRHLNILIITSIRKTTAHTKIPAVKSMKNIVTVSIVTLGGFCTKISSYLRGQRYSDIRIRIPVSLISWRLEKKNN